MTKKAEIVMAVKKYNVHDFNLPVKGKLSLIYTSFLLIAILMAVTVLK